MVAALSSSPFDSRGAAAWVRTGIMSDAVNWRRVAAANTCPCILLQSASAAPLAAAADARRKGECRGAAWLILSEPGVQTVSLQLGLPGCKVGLWRLSRLGAPAVQPAWLRGRAIFLLFFSFSRTCAFFPCVIDKAAPACQGLVDTF